MENQKGSGGDQVVLILPGIDKKWVRNKKGMWVDLESLKHDIMDSKTREEVAVSSEEWAPVTKKWWQFWK